MHLRIVCSLVLACILVACATPQHSNNQPASADTAVSTASSPPSDTTVTDSIAKRIDGTERVVALFSWSKGSGPRGGTEPPPTHLQVLPLAFIQDGTYYKASEWRKNPFRRLSRRKTLMNRHPTYDVLVDTFSTMAFAIDSLANDGYACVDLTVGRGHLLNADTTDSGLVEAIRSSGTERTRYVRGLAISTDRGTGPARYRPATASALSRSTSTMLRERARRYMEAEADSTIDASIRVEHIPVDFEHDGTTEYIVVANRTTKQGRQSFLFVGRFVDGKWVELLRRSKPNKPSAWGHGYSLLQIADLDGNGHPELIVRVNGYERFGFEIYAYREGRLHKVFEDTPYLC